MKIHDMAMALKKKTDAGAILFDGGNYYDKPEWRITGSEISFAQGNMRVMIFGDGWGNATDAEQSLKEMRALVDA